MNKPREFWIMGNKCHPHGHIVPDNYKKHGELYIEKSAYDKLYLEVQRLKNRDMDCTEALFNERIAWSAADKLAEALENYIDAIENSKAMDLRWAHQALKEYRGESE